MRIDYNRRTFLAHTGSFAALCLGAGAAQAQDGRARIALRPIIESTQNVVLDPGREYYLDRATDLRSGQTIDGQGAKVLLPRDRFNYTGNKCSLFHSDNGLAFRVQQASDVTIENLRIVKEFENLVGTVGIWGDSVDNLVLRNVSLSGFSNANGVITMSGARNCLISGCRIFDCHVLEAEDRYQLTGIQFDDCRIGGAHSSDNRIVGNYIHDFHASTFLHPGARLGSVETDGINLHGGTRYQIAHNRIFGMGEGIDIFCDDSVLEENEILYTLMFGIKVTHGASGNVIRGNRISISGREDTRLNTFGIWVLGSSNGVSAANRIVGSVIDLANAPSGAVAIMIGDLDQNAELTANTVVDGNAVWMNASGQRVGICDAGLQSEFGSIPARRGSGQDILLRGQCKRGITRSTE